MNCKICNTQTNKSFSNIIKNNYEAEYFYCPNCSFLFIGNPKWLDEAYKKPINTTDTGYIMRNIYLSKKTLILFFIIFNKKLKYLDYAGGYGVLTRIMRDYGLDFFISDPYTKNIFAQGFEYTDQKIEAITCFECFEHFINPIEEIEKILKISKNLFFSTQLITSKIPDKNWDYYGLEHGQHISFYSIKTIKFLSKKYNLNYYSDGKNLHLLTTKKINPFYFKIILLSSKLQTDLLIKKLLKSKTVSDFNLLKKTI